MDAQHVLAPFLSAQSAGSNCDDCDRSFIPQVLHSISAQCASKRLYVRCLLAYLVMMPGQILFYLYDLYMGTDPAARWFALFEKEKILRDSFAEYLRSTPNVTISSWICGRAPGCDQFLDQLWEKLSK